MPFSSLPLDPVRDARAAQEGQVEDPTLGELFAQVVPFGGTFDRAPLRDDTFNAKNVEESLRRLDEVLETPTNSLTNLEILARLLRGSYFRATIKASTDVSPLDDTPVAHGLGRRPSVVMFSVDLGGCGGLILARPQGLLQADGGNVRPWDEDHIFLRASKSSTYEAITL